jgi:ATP-dependent RNA helicase SUPV3L1/SUV3
MSITAVLAPTNTGKTHRAVERMLEHPSGMIGLPLRLLAREVYDRITARIGEAAVALVTGEEKRVPRAPRYWVCTVESMPTSRPVDFLAVDEIQLGAHPQRGHVFTDRLLHARGLSETWFMGSDTMRPLIEKLVPEADIRRHPRLSELRHVGAMSLRSLPPRSAVVAFSADQVYELAERLRERRGGVAVVLGALSPRTRNAQVALYQSGEVQYMVATDAIGMGLNMDVDHIAFAALQKFDGREARFLEPDELAQIAGRAGRYQSDGTFGTLSSVPALGRGVVKAIETHRFRPVERLVWRNSELDMRSLDALVASLRRPPARSVLQRVDHAEDFRALLRLGADQDIRGRAQGTEAVVLLWEVCQIPDFRKLLEETHVDLLGEIYRQLTGPAGRLDPDWMNRRVVRLDDVEGDIDTLMRRIAFVRTWTYVSHRVDWVRDAEAWQERTRDIEDRLSDALHERLVQRFVAKRIRGGGGREVTRADSGSPFAKLRDLLEQEVDSPAERWVADVVEAGYEAFQVDTSGLIRFGEHVIGRMSRGVDLLRPEVTLPVEQLGRHLGDHPAQLGAGAHARILRRLTAWVRDLVAESLAPLRGERAGELSPAGRGLVYQLEQGLGTVHRDQAREQIANLSPDDRAILAALDVRIGGPLVYVRSLLSPAALARRAALISASLPPGVSVDAPRPGAASMALRPDLDAAVYTAMGYPAFGPRAIRADMAERASRVLADAGRGGKPFAVPPQLSNLLGCKAEVLPEVVAAFGYRALDDGRLVSTRQRRRRRRERRAQ